MDVFLLWHVHEKLDGEEDVKLIGAYSTREKAAEARGRVVSQPEFKEFPDRFQIDAYRLDQDHWTEGFATV